MQVIKLTWLKCLYTYTYDALKLNLFIKKRTTPAADVDISKISIFIVRNIRSRCQIFLEALLVFRCVNTRAITAILYAIAQRGPIDFTARPYSRLFHVFTRIEIQWSGKTRRVVLEKTPIRLLNLNSTEFMRILRKGKY